MCHVKAKGPFRVSPITDRDRTTKSLQLLHSQVFGFIFSDSEDLTLPVLGPPLSSSVLSPSGRADRTVHHGRSGITHGHARRMSIAGCVDLCTSVLLAP